MYSSREVHDSQVQNTRYTRVSSRHQRQTTQKCESFPRSSTPASHYFNTHWPQPRPHRLFMYRVLINRRLMVSLLFYSSTPISAIVHRTDAAQVGLCFYAKRCSQPYFYAGVGGNVEYCDVDVDVPVLEVIIVEVEYCTSAGIWTYQLVYCALTDA